MTVISFELADLEGVTTLHEDALVIRARFVNYKVRSSMNILFKEVLDHMHINPVELQLLSTSLFGFVGHEVPPLG